MVVTPLYTGLLALLLVVLSIRVIGLRRREGVGFGHAGHPALERRIRAQANLAEYAPLAPLLIGLLELSSFPPLVLHALEKVPVAGRLLHAWALSFTDGSPRARVGGMAMTFTAIGLGAALNLFQAGRTLAGADGAA